MAIENRLLVSWVYSQAVQLTTQNKLFFSSSFLFCTVVFVFINTRTLTHVKKIPPSSAKEKKTSINIYTFPSIHVGRVFSFLFFTRPKGGWKYFRVGPEIFTFFFSLFFTTRQQ
jgi:hypothetical protein